MYKNFLLLLILFPLVTYAAWWNPVSWFSDVKQGDIESVEYWKGVAEERQKTVEEQKAEIEDLRSRLIDLGVGALDTVEARDELADIAEELILRNKEMTELLWLLYNDECSGYISLSERDSICFMIRESNYFENYTPSI
jgi:hypothetical protein